MKKQLFCFLKFIERNSITKLIKISTTHVLSINPVAFIFFPVAAQKIITYCFHRNMQCTACAPSVISRLSLIIACVHTNWLQHVPPRHKLNLSNHCPALRQRQKQKWTLTLTHRKRFRSGCTCLRFPMNDTVFPHLEMVKSSLYGYIFFPITFANTSAHF